MFRNYATTALRNLLHNKLYAAINIVGLGVGFAAALLIALFVRDEFSYDKWMPEHQRIYLLTETIKFPGRTPTESHGTPMELAEPLKLDFPAIEAVARVVHDNISLRRGDTEANESLYWADPDVFDVLPLRARSGDLRSALRRPDGLVLTQRMAHKYFGDADPIGTIIEINREHPMMVTAVIEDLPPNTHLSTEIFGSGLAAFSPIAQRKAKPLPAFAWEDSEYTYLKLAPGASGQDLESALPAFLDHHMSERGKIGNAPIAFDVVLHMTPIAQVHLKSESRPSFMKPAGDPKAANALAIIGLLILVIASINFVNLMTARAARRAVEVGVRKVTGANRGNLVVQFLGESLIYSTIGTSVAMVVAELLLPSFNAFLDRSIDFRDGHSAIFGLEIIGAAVLVGTLAGFYPAFVLSHFKPAMALKGLVKQGPGAGFVRKALVTLQFAILVGLIVCVGVIYRQTSFALNEGLRQDRDQIVLVATRCKTAFPERVRALPGVRAAACSAQNGLNPASANGGYKRLGDQPVGLSVEQVDFGYFKLSGIQPLAGRLFAREHSADSTPVDYTSPIGPSFIINGTAVRRFGFASPEAAIGQTLTAGFSSIPGVDHGPTSEIVGVVPDFSLNSIHNLIAPSAYYVAPPTFRWLNIKLTGKDLPETLRAINALWKETGDPRPITLLFLDQEVQNLYIDISRQSQLFAAFSGVALFIATLGLLGLSTFTAEQRTKEIGIRKAMGASRSEILRMLLWQFAKPVLGANLIAWPVAGYLMNHWLHGFAYHVDLDPFSFLGASLIALAIAVLTVLGHAILVARAKPVSALRYE